MKFKQIVEKRFTEWKDNGFCQEAVILNKRIRERNNRIIDNYFDTANPGAFTGKLDSEVVLVHLNPKRDKNGKEPWGKKCEEDFDTYWDRHVNFGEKKYGKDVLKKEKSKFDLKQIRFLKHFGIFDFNNDKDNPFHDLVEVMQKKLQLDLVPFGSPNFDYNVIGVENLKPFVETILDLIFEYKNKRKYIIFCGRVFEKILTDADFIIKEKTKIYPDHLPKKIGGITKNLYSVIVVTLKYKNSEITACIAPQFAQQGCPIDEYGKFVYKSFNTYTN